MLSFRCHHPVLGLLLAVGTLTQVHAQPLVLDGDLSEWSRVEPLATDPAGDATGAMDIRAVRVQSRETTIYVALDFEKSVSLSAGAKDDPTLRLTLGVGEKHLIIDFRGRKAYMEGLENSSIPWSRLNFLALPTAASSRYEMHIDLDSLGAKLGDTVNISFAGCDSLSKLVTFTLKEPADKIERRSAKRPLPPTPPTPRALRLVSLNTEQTGLTNPSKLPALKRLIDAVDADIYCFCEEYKSSQAQIEQVLNETDPLENKKPWHVVKSNDLVIASQYEMLTVNVGAGYMGALVQAKGDEFPVPMNLLVINNHMKCCGYAGSKEDEKRIQQTTEAVASFKNFREGKMSQALAEFADAPAIIVGDWNLVGSSTPLDMWLNKSGPALTREYHHQLIGSDGWTWRSASKNDASFWPSAIDLIVYDAHRLHIHNSFSLDSAKLNKDELEALGLEAGDSDVTDHLMTVVDIDPASPPTKPVSNKDLVPSPTTQTPATSKPHTK